MHSFFRTILLWTSFFSLVLTLAATSYVRAEGKDKSPTDSQQKTSALSEEEINKLDKKLENVLSLQSVKDIVLEVQTRNGNKQAGALVYNYLYRNFSTLRSEYETIVFCLKFLKDHSQANYDELLADIQRTNFLYVFPDINTGLYKSDAVIKALNYIFGEEVMKDATAKFLARNNKGTSLVAFAGQKDIRSEIKSYIREIETQANVQDLIFLLSKVSSLITRDFGAEDSQNNLKNDSPLVEREDVIDSLIDSLIRVDLTIPTLVGESGTGLSSILLGLSRSLRLNEYPKKEKYGLLLKNTRVFEVSASRIITVANDIGPEGMLTVFDILQKRVLGGKNIIVAIDNLKLLNPMFVSELIRLAPNYPKIKLVFTATNEALAKIDAEFPRMTSRKLNTILVRPLSREDVIESLESYYFPFLEKEYGIAFDTSSIETLIKGASNVYSNLNLLEASKKMALDIAVAEFRKTNQSTSSLAKQASQVDEYTIFKYIEQSLGVPVNPYDAKAFRKYIDNLTHKISEEIVDQDRMINDVMGLFSDLIQDNSTNIKVGMLLGPTGVGKTELGSVLAKLALENPDAFLEVDGNAYKEKYSLTSLVGMSNGYESANKTQGMLGDFLMNPLKGGKFGIFLLNELEKADPAVVERIMEFLEKGTLQTGNGTLVRPKKILVLFTSNKADNLLFPKDMAKWSREEVIKYLGKFTNNDLKDIVAASQGGQSEHKLHNSVVGRFDLVSIANPTTKDTTVKIGNKIANSFIHAKKDELKFNINITDDLIEHLSHFEFDMSKGARPVVKRVKSYLGQALLAARETWDLTPNANINFSYENKDTAKIKIQWGRKVIRIDAPKEIIDDPYEDKELLKKLGSLHASLEKKIHGQSEGLQSIADAVTAHLTNINLKKALSIFIVGTTGTGKTQTAKALAGLLYGSEDRIGKMDLGQVKDGSSWGRYFGIEPNYQGGKEIGIFETILIGNPNGGVIVFDEASNMGGIDKNTKEDLFQRLYSITDEKTWTSPNTRREYDLSKYVFIFTGNDGQELFEAYSADYMRLKIYNKNKERAKVEKMMVRRGLPAPMAGRMADIILWKPLLTTEVKEIATDMIDSLFKTYKNRNIKFHFDDSFYSQFNSTFFNTRKGGRSIENVVNNRLKASIDELLISAISKGRNPKDSTIYISVSDNLPKLPYLPDWNWERKVNFELTLKKSNEVIAQKTSDATSFANSVVLSSKSDSLSTSYHEMGHAVVNNPKISKTTVDYITIVGADNYLGFASYEELKSATGHNPTKEIVILTVAQLRAGGIAQKLAGFDFDAGWRNDMERVNALLNKAITEYSLDYRNQINFQSTSINSDIDKSKNKHQSISQQELVASIAQEWLEEADRIAIGLLVKDWNVVRAGSSYLIKNGYIDGQTYKQIRKNVETAQNLALERGEEVVKWKIHYIPGAKDKFKDMRIIRVNPSKEKAFSCKQIFQ